MRRLLQALVRDRRLYATAWLPNHEYTYVDTRRMLNTYARWLVRDLQDLDPSVTADDVEWEVLVFLVTEDDFLVPTGPQLIV